jgi:hypothetical protein
VVLVDLGYLLAEGGKAYCGAVGRSNSRCDYEKAAIALEDFAVAHAGIPVLRSYWYDGAPDYVPTQDHLLIAGLPRVKLRLGRLVIQKKSPQQKGVDSLIVHDLITLAHERAVATMFLLAGDEDVREGVAAAQRLGVQVILLGIPTPTGWSNQSQPLVREADEHLLIEDTLLKPFFRKAGFQAGAPAPLASEAKKDPRAAAAEAGKRFAATWAEAAEPSEVAELLAHAPDIPRELDVQLLVRAEEALGISLRGEQEIRHALREGFWVELADHAKAHAHRRDGASDNQ